jgi:ElaB/YqjD/DUF883 family membrane-anchored ribosome-binding protein
MNTSKAEKVVNKLADDAIHATEQAADQAERGVDSARSFANEALDKADAKVRSLREDIKPAIDAMSSRVQDMAARGKAACAQTRDQTRDKVNEYADRTTAYVQEQPLKSVAIAAAAGALVALVLGRRR